VGGMSKAMRGGRRQGRGPGFTLIEMLFTLSLSGIVLAVAVPSFARINADIRTRSTAEQLAGALRLAQVSAVTRNRPAAFVLTDAAPGEHARATINGRNWLVKFLPPTSARGEPATRDDLIQVATIALQNRVTLTGPAQVCFDAQGLQAMAPGAAGAAALACSAPGDEHGGPTSYRVSRADAPRRFDVRGYRTGRVAVCDAAPDGAPPAATCR